MFASVARRLLGLGVLGVFLLPGCGKSPVLAEVEGTLSYQGVPLQNVLVEFIPDEADQPRSTGVTNAAGRFVLECSNGEPGAVVGSHRVVLAQAGRAHGGAGKRNPRHDTKVAAPPPADTVPESNSQILAPYGSATRTSLRPEVLAGNQTIDLKLP